MLRNNVGTMSPAFTTPLPEFADKVLRRNMATTGHILAPHIDVYQVVFKGKAVIAAGNVSRLIPD